ncbi:hypothetical protein Igag_1167 [Ignisphaera aggregans DSM 17230]|uniref:DHH family phosphoesterase n=1 Tax=Ignisphaera aggregans (strain DSM 17230 / JCM 13409 / AQ1.S1) TaxID=583356 RepID=E0SP27_IGNAA|nr:hypothetical protein Igag_1167 [Ignisphaera aggregans DSM 17230]
MKNKALMIFHGDCDGVISAGLYIRHFLLDYYPSNLVMRYSHPWRLHIDLKKFLSLIKKDDIDTIVLLDLAINNDVIKILSDYLRNSRARVIIVDHHLSSQHILETIKNSENIKVYWGNLQSTPQVLSSYLIKNLNSYEQSLVSIANICEGGGSDNIINKNIADKVKLVLAVEPTNEKLILETVISIVKGEEFWNSKTFDEKFNRAKWLLNLLIKRIEERSKEVCGWRYAVFTSAESLIFAGLFGIASSEYIKKCKAPLVLLREEEDKIVLTIRSAEGKALEFCRTIYTEFNNVMDISYGGHKEAASATIRNYGSLKQFEEIFIKFLQKNLCDKT